jgi:hypothetical protein
MTSLNVLFYATVTLLWIALAAFIIIRVPKCKTVPKAGQIFVIIFLLLQVFIHGHQLYEILVKENIIKITNTLKTSIVSDKETLNSLSNLLLGSQWFNLLSFAFMVVLYYIIFKAIYKCSEKIIDTKLMWAFVILTIVQYLTAATVKSTTENKLLLSAMAK